MITEQEITEKFGVNEVANRVKDLVFNYLSKYPEFNNITIADIEESSFTDIGTLFEVGEHLFLMLDEDEEEEKIIKSRVEMKEEALKSIPFYLRSYLDATQYAQDYVGCIEDIYPDAVFTESYCITQEQ